jgi:O-methyltransferase
MEVLIGEVRSYTKSSVLRLVSMVESLQYLARKKIEGDIVECGVWAGGNIILSRKILPHRMCWLYDTFTGMTEPGPYDKKRKDSTITALDRYRARGGKWADVSLEQVRKNLAVTNTLDDNYLRFIEGPVEETLLKPENLPGRIALLRLDTDWYESTKIELEVLYPRLTRGGVLIIDDYGHWMGARKATDDYFLGHNIELEKVDKTARRVIKRC